MAGDKQFLKKIILKDMHEEMKIKEWDNYYNS